MVETFTLPARSEVGLLDPEIAGEGQKVLLSDGEQVNWTPPSVKPVIPDMSQVKAIRHYFGRTGFQPYPAWLYHPTEKPRIVKNATEAAALGVHYRKASEQERNRYGIDSVWDYAENSPWRSKPYEGNNKADPSKDGGKIVIVGTPNPAIAQNELVRALIPEVAAAVAQALKGAGPTAPSNVDPEQWEEFKAFLAFRKSAEAVESLGAAQPVEAPDTASNALAASPMEASPEEERATWSAEAERRGVKVDGRWSLARLKDEVSKAA